MTGLFDHPPSCHQAVVSAVSRGVRDRAAIIDEVCREAGVTAATVSSELSQSVRDGILVRPARGTYELHPAIMATVAADG